MPVAEVVDLTYTGAEPMPIAPVRRADGRPEAEIRQEAHSIIGLQPMLPETVAEMGRQLQPPVAFAMESVAELCAWAKFKYPVKTGTRFVTRDRGSGPTTFIWSAPPPYGSLGRELAGGIELEAIRVITVVIPKGTRRWDTEQPGICI